MKNLIFVLFLFLTGFSWSQDFVINNVKVFDGETVLENASVSIKEGKIFKISTSELTADTIIDGKGKTLLPALTNCHVHAWSPMNLQEAAKAGVLNVLDMHTVESVIPYLEIYHEQTDYADYFAAGAAATAPKGHGTQYGFPTPTLTQPEEAKDFINGRVNAGAHYIKIIKEPGKSTLDSTTVAALVKEAHAKNKKTVVHVSRKSNALEVIRSGADGLAHIWRDSIMSDRQMKSLVEHKFFVVPTMLIRKSARELYDKSNRKVVYITVEELKSEVFRLYENKVPILAGTDPPNLQLNYGTDLYKEIELIHESGVPTIDALKSATSLPAIHFGLPNRGFIKEGYRADLILVDGDLLQDIKAIWNAKRVWKQGKEVNTK